MGLDSQPIQARTVIRGSVEPDNTEVLWIDTSGDTPVLKQYDGNSFVKVADVSWQEVSNRPTNTGTFSRSSGYIVPDTNATLTDGDTSSGSQITLPDGEYFEVSGYYATDGFRFHLWNSDAYQVIDTGDNTVISEFTHPGSGWYDETFPEVIESPVRFKNVSGGESYPREIRMHETGVPAHSHKL